VDCSGLVSAILTGAVQKAGNKSPKNGEIALLLATNR